MLRITGGELRGRKLKTIDEDILRPTSERVREAIFSMLEGRDAVSNSNVLDLFAGSGALGFEALSRGASSATFVEQNRKVSAALSENVSSLSVDDKSKIVNTDVMKYLATEPKKDHRFNLIFADPPYDLDSLEELVDAILLGKSSLLDASGVFVLEIAKHRSESVAAFESQILKRRKYGSTEVVLFKKLV